MSMKTGMNKEQPRRLVAEDVRSLKGSVVLLDVRTPAEYEELHIAESVLHPLSELDVELVREHIADSDHCVLICRSGNRAAQAAQKLADAGIPNLVILEGGVSSWDKAGLPLNRGRAMMSLERQVRIVAGAFVFLGTVLGALVNPYFLIVPGFMGAGLVFAGVTDWCGMGMFIAKMPWNRRSSTTCKSCLT